MSAAAIRRLRHEPAFAAYLLALALLPIKWLSPLGGLSERAGWTDVFAAIAVALWLVEGRHRGFSWRPRGFYVGLGAYLALGALSMLIASDDRHTGAENLLIMVELAGLALLTADFARDRERRRAILVIVGAGALLTAAIAAVALVLFYAGVKTSAIGQYGELVASHRYARVTAGFYSPPLLASYCIFASALVSHPEAPLSPRLRRATQLALAGLVLVTVSRAIIGFVVAIAMRRAHRHSPRRARFLIAGAGAAAVALMVSLTIGHLQVDPTRPSTVAYQVPDPGNRHEELTTSLRTLGRHPLLGTGPGSLPGTKSALPARAHFTPLNIAATLGLPALLALLGALGSLWLRRGRPIDIAIWSGLAGLGIDALGQDVEHFRHVWVMIGLAVATAAAADSAAQRPAARRSTRLPRRRAVRCP